MRWRVFLAGCHAIHSLLPRDRGGRLHLEGRAAYWQETRKPAQKSSVPVPGQELWSAPHREASEAQVTRGSISHASAWK